MKIRLIKIGRIKKDYETPIARFQKRLNGLCQIDFLEFKNDPPAIKFLSELQGKGGQELVCLDEHGVQYTSTSFARELSRKIDDPLVKGLNFVVGGPYGLPQELRKKPKLTWALSDLTVPSDLAWLMLNEQMYRAYCIVNGTPYHHE